MSKEVMADHKTMSLAYSLGHLVIENQPPMWWNRIVMVCLQGAYQLGSVDLSIYRDLLHGVRKQSYSVI